MELEIDEDLELDFPQEYIVLGRNVGKAKGWDKTEDWSLFLYDFKPNLAFSNLPSGDLNFNFQTGKIETFDDEGQVLLSLDMINTLYS